MANPKKDSGLNCPLFVLDFNSMKDILEGRALNNKFFKAMVHRKSNQLPFVAVTTLSAFKRAMYLCNDTSPMQNIKFIMDAVTIYPSNADYKDANAVNIEFNKFLKLKSEGGL